MTTRIYPGRPMALSLIQQPDLHEPPPAPGAGSPATDASVAAPDDGLYAGGNSDVTIDLRVDSAGCGVISGDIYRRLADARHYVASFRTAPGQRQRWTGSWIVIGQDEHGRRVQGTLTLQRTPGAAAVLSGGLTFEGALEGLPSRRLIPFVCERASGGFRKLGLEIEIEEHVEPIGSSRHGDRDLTIEDALQAAGFDTQVTGISDRIPASEGGWDMAQLHALMTDLAQVPLGARSWDIHMLLLSRSDRRGLLGVMFDSSEALPRQGCAVFAEEIRDIRGIDHNRKLIQTSVHELGHALNLAHRFERVVGRADSLSFMNYDWRYRGGNRASEFWKQFAFTFDPDELEFLRHAPLPPLIPGGAPFHSVAYWADGGGGYSPYVPEAPLAGWSLSLTPSGSGSVLKFAEPVLLRAVLANNSGRTVSIPTFMLDPKAGFIEMLIRRVHAGAAGTSTMSAQAFSPIMQRCFQWDAADAIQLKHGESIEDNVNVTFGSGGFAFAEPGTYEVTALLVIYDEGQQRELIAKSNTVRIRVGAPRTDADERDAMDLFTDDVGLYLALGGSSAMAETREKLDVIADRRGNDPADPIVAYIQRAHAIDDSRTYVRYRDQQFRTDAPKTERALATLRTLQAGAMPMFDRATARQTEHLTAFCAARVNGERDPVAGPIAPRRLSPEQTLEAIEESSRASYRPSRRG